MNTKDFLSYTKSKVPEKYRNFVERMLDMNNVFGVPRIAWDSNEMTLREILKWKLDEYAIYKHILEHKEKVY